jgi:CDP-diacylglycerol---glycerol-3-phosphate 3-phosphatidyltransferase
VIQCWEPGIQNRALKCEEVPISKNTSQAKMQTLRKAIAVNLTGPVVSLLAKTGITPDQLTWCGFIITLASAALAATGHLFAAGWVMLIAGCFDMLDGALARRTNRVTKFGGVLDSTLDRLSESAVLLGIMAYFLFQSPSDLPGLWQWMALLAGLALVFSFMVSYIRSRAEAAGAECQVGISTRTERVIITALGLLVAMNLSLAIALAIITVLSAVTVVQRLAFVHGQVSGIKK